MLRLAHRILQSANHSLVTWAKTREARSIVNYPSLVENMDKIKRRVAESHIIVADNVADLLAESEQQEWDLFDDFHCARPPFVHTFIEWNAPKRVLLRDGWKENPTGQIGWSFMCPDDKRVAMMALNALRGNSAIQDSDAQELIRFYHKSKWIVLADAFLYVGGLPCTWTGMPAFMFLSDEGRVLKFFYVPINPASRTPGFTPSAISPTQLLNEALLALSFMHCKNVVRTDATEAEGPPAKWLRRMKQPTLRYHVLNINPMKEVLRKEGESETTGLKKALHICRGHFATYTADKPLFGHFTGTVYKPAHIRGSKELGTVLKGYAVNEPTPKDSSP